MGYRTKGLWIIKGPVNDITAAWVACRLALTPPEPSNWDEFEVFRRKDFGYIRFEFDDWKWYGSFNDIKFYESVWTGLSDFADDQETNTISGKRIHVGEDNASEELVIGKGHYDIEIYTSCSIEDSEPCTGDPISLPATTPATATPTP